MALHGKLSSRAIEHVNVASAVHARDKAHFARVGTGSKVSLKLPRMPSAETNWSRIIPGRQLAAVLDESGALKWVSGDELTRHISRCVAERKTKMVSAGFRNGERRFKRVANHNAARRETLTLDNAQCELLSAHSSLADVEEMMRLICAKFEALTGWYPLAIDCHADTANLHFDLLWAKRNRLGNLGPNARHGTFRLRDGALIAERQKRRGYPVDPVIMEGVETHMKCSAAKRHFRFFWNLEVALSLDEWIAGWAAKKGLQAEFAELNTKWSKLKEEDLERVAMLRRIVAGEALPLTHEQAAELAKAIGVYQAREAKYRARLEAMEKRCADSEAKAAKVGMSQRRGR